MVKKPSFFLSARKIGTLSTSEVRRRLIETGVLIEIYHNGIFIFFESILESLLSARLAPHRQDRYVFNTLAKGSFREMEFKKSQYIRLIKQRRLLESRVQVLRRTK